MTARVTVNRAQLDADKRQAARPATARRAAPAPDMHAVARSHAEQALALGRKAAHMKGYALAKDALKAATALGWGPVVNSETARDGGLPLTSLFKGGNRAVIQLQSFVLMPAAK